MRDLKRAGIMVAHFAAEGRPVRGRVAAGVRAPHNPLPPGGQNTQAEGQSRLAKIFLFIRISVYRIDDHPNPAEGRIAIVTNAGWDVVDAGGVGAKGFAGRETVSEGVAHTTGAACVRQNRVVLAPGVCAPSVAVMSRARPGARISHPQGDGGNSASLPGESTT
jgi:hypothetical protein